MTSKSCPLRKLQGQLCYTIKFEIEEMQKHSNTPITVGITIENSVQPILLVSFFMVRQVVEHGK